ncbi:MAG: hypothetical protein AB7U75_19915 [Hyphomicrobiaceae bacterium]
MNKRNTSPSPFTTPAAYAAALEEAAAFWSKTLPPIHPSELNGQLGPQAAAIYTKTLHRVSTLLGIRTNRLIRTVDHTLTEFQDLHALSEAFIPLPPPAAVDERSLLDAAERVTVFDTLRDEFSMFRDIPNMTNHVETLIHTPKGFVFSVVRCLRALIAHGYDPDSLKTIHHANAALAEVARQSIHWKEHSPNDNLPQASLTRTTQR